MYWLGYLYILFLIVVPMVLFVANLYFILKISLPVALLGALGGVLFVGIVFLFSRPSGHYDPFLPDIKCTCIGVQSTVTGIQGDTYFQCLGFPVACKRGNFDGLQ